MQKFCKEVVVWKTLHHPNVLPLIGVKMSENEFAMISDWMANGNINDFIRAHPGINRITLVGFPLERFDSSLIDKCETPS